MFTWFGPLIVGFALGILSHVWYSYLMCKYKCPYKKEKTDLLDDFYSTFCKKDGDQ